MAACSQYVYEAMVNCRYHSNDHDDAGETDHEYRILCIGNSITAVSYGITSLLTFIGVVYAILFSKTHVVSNYIVLYPLQMRKLIFLLHLWYSEFWYLIPVMC